MSATTPGDRVIVALDVESHELAAQIVEQLLPMVGGFAIGHIAMAEGWDRTMVERLRDSGKMVLYDAHLNATPRITGKAVRAYARLGVTHLSICGTAGAASIRAAVEHRGDMEIVVTTVLTSMSENDVRREYGRRLDEVVRKHARAAAVAGAQGMICAPQELEIVRAQPATDRLVKIVNGIRFPDVPLLRDDLQRIQTPGRALAAGADRLLVGRPVVEPPQGTPLESVERLLAEIEARSTV